MAVHAQLALKSSRQAEVLVCGIGCAGIAAALAAARAGAHTMAVEQWPFAGGNITAANVPGCCGLADMVTGELTAGGIGLELLAATGAIQLPLKSTRLFEPILDEKTLASRHTKLPYFWDIERLKVVCDRALADSGVQFLYHTKVADVVMKGPRIDSVVLANKSGLTAVQPKVIVDCTGDADVAAWAGVPCDKDASPQPMTLEFYIGGVGNWDDRQGLQDRCAAVLTAGRKQKKLGIYGGPWLSFPWPGVIRLNAVRLTQDSSNAGDLSRAEVLGRETAWRMLDLWKESLTEFKGAFFMFSGPAAGARESRRIRGLYTLTRQDIESRREFPDAIGKGSWYLDLHPADAPGYHPHHVIRSYQIPYRTLVPEMVENLLVAGRCHSATHEALASSRVGMTAMVMGHAAGVAAALAARGGIAAADVDVPSLRGHLLKQNAIVDYEKEVQP